MTVSLISVVLFFWMVRYLGKNIKAGLAQVKQTPSPEFEQRMQALEKAQKDLDAGWAKASKEVTDLSIRIGNFLKTLDEEKVLEDAYADEDSQISFLNQHYHEEVFDKYSDKEE